MNKYIYKIKIAPRRNLSPLIVILHMHVKLYIVGFEAAQI